MPRVKISLLGPFQVVQDGKPAKGLTSEKIQALLAYLVLETGRPHAREELAALLWPEHSGQKAMQNLRQSLSRLQRAIPLGDALLVTRQAVQFYQESDIWLDTAVFTEVRTFCRKHTHRHLYRCRRCGRKLEAGAALYRGDFLQGTQSDSLPFEEWALLKREWFRREAILLLHDLAKRYEWQGRYDEAHRAAWRQVEIDPFRENAHRQVMRALALSGREQEALRQYRSLTELLREELNVKPATETTALFEAIRSRNLVAEPGRDERAIAASLPAYHRPFIGRDEELAQIAERLDNPHCHLLTLVGFGGVGKSRLAVETAREKADEYEDGICFVPLSAVPTADFIAPAIADRLGLHPPAGGGRLAREKQLLEALRSKELLLVLDNFEHLLPDYGPVLDILERAPRTKLLATSRHPLNLRAEWLVDVDGLPYPAPDNSTPPSKFESVQLFAQNVARIQPDFKLSPELAAEVVQICRLVEGVPLAIELAAASVRHISLADMVREIAQDLDFLATVMPDVPKRQRSTRASFEYSWRLLSAAEKRVLRELSVFRGGFSLEAAEQICFATPELIANLANKLLLRPISATTAGDDARYDLHELVRQFAAEKLGAWPEQEATVSEKHCDFYTRLLAAHEDDLVKRGWSENLILLGPEAENVRSAWDWAIATQSTRPIARSLEAVVEYYSQRGWISEAESLLERTATMLLMQGTRTDPGEALSLGAEAATLLLGRVWAQQGALASILNLEDQKGRHLLQKSLRIFRGFGLDEEVAHALQALARDDRQSGEFRDARRRLDESLQIARMAGSKHHVALALAELAFLAYLQSETEEGLRFGRQCLEIHQGEDDLRGTGRILNTMGLLESQRGNTGKASRFLTESVEIYRRLGDTFREGAALNNLGLVAYVSGEFPEAERRFLESESISQKVGEPYGVALALYNRGRVAHARKDYALARNLHARSLNIRLEMANRYLSGISYFYLGQAHRALGEHDQACDCFYHALERVTGSDNAHLQLQVLTAIAGELARAGQTEEALALLHYVLRHPAIAKKIGDFPVEEEAHMLLEQVQERRSSRGLGQVQDRLQDSTLADVIEDVLSRAPAQAR